MKKDVDKYVGINNDQHGGMTNIGKIILDAWVFGLIEEKETGENWKLSAIEVLNHQVNAEWDKYGCMVSQLPEDLFERHQRIYQEAMERAKTAGWSGEIETAKDT